jgi:hypothetical protein
MLLKTILYKKSLGGFMYYVKYIIATDSETIITKANYTTTSVYTEGTNYFEGNSSSPNQFTRIAIASVVPPCMVTLPAPATLPNKEFIITFIYGSANTPFVAGKMLTDVTPTNTDNFLASPASFPISIWGANTRTIKCISDGVNWLTFRH